MLFSLLYVHCDKQSNDLVRTRSISVPAPTDSNCVCGQKRSQLHPFSCAHARKHRQHLWCKKRLRQLTPDEVLGTPEGVTAFAKWAPADLVRDSLQGQHSILFSHTCQINVLYYIIYYEITKFLTGHAEF